MVQHIVAFMDGLPPLPLLMLYSALVSPVLVVVHELGHALAALWRTDGRVFVRLGAKRRRWRVQSGRFAMEAGPSELALAGGFCAYNAAGISPVSSAIISIAGPVASLAGAALTAVLWQATGGVLRDVLATATLGGCFVGIINALPLTFTSSRSRPGPVIRLDGRAALDALRLNDARVPLYLVAPEVPDDRHATSIPPPGHS